MSNETLCKLSEKIESQNKDLQRPPLHLWHPELSGDIDILIRRDGSWIHEGRPIERASLVRLFASILRREEDGEYYLVTPVEKWRLQVESLPLLVVDFDLEEEGEDGQRLTVELNTGRRYAVGVEYPLYLYSAGGEEPLAAVQLEHGLAALFSRAAWYRLAELCEERDGVPGIASAGEFYPLQN